MEHDVGSLPAIGPSLPDRTAEAHGDTTVFVTSGNNDLVITGILEEELLRHGQLVHQIQRHAPDLNIGSAETEARTDDVGAAPQPLERDSITPSRSEVTLAKLELQIDDAARERHACQTRR